MVMVIRTVPLTNTTGAAITVGGADTSVGQDLAGIQVKRILVAADIGTGAGQLRHANGMISAEVTGAYIKSATIDVYRPNVDGFVYKFTYLTDATQNVGYSITNVAGVSTLRLKDSAGANGRLAAADIVVVTISVGHGAV